MRLLEIGYMYTYSAYQPANTAQSTRTLAARSKIRVISKLIFIERAAAVGDQ